MNIHLEDIIEKGLFRYSDDTYSIIGAKCNNVFMGLSTYYDDMADDDIVQFMSISNNGVKSFLSNDNIKVFHNQCAVDLDVAYKIFDNSLIKKAKKELAERTIAEIKINYDIFMGESNEENN